MINYPPPPPPPPLLPSYKILRTKNSCLCCLIFACFYFVNEFLLVLCFCVTKIFLKKICVCLDSLIYYTTENSQNLFLYGPFWSVKYFIFGQKLPIQTAHHTFLESRQREVAENLYTHFIGSSSWTTSENVEKVYEKKTLQKKFIIFPEA